MVIDEDGICLNCHNDYVLRINCGPIDISASSPDKFKFYIVKTKQNRETDFCEVKFCGERIGWVFPLLSFNDRTQFDSSRWAKIFSNFALFALTHDESISAQANIPEMSRVEWDVIDFFDESTAIIVLGKEALDIHTLDSDKIVFSLMQNYYCPINKADPATSLFERLPP